MGNFFNMEGPFFKYGSLFADILVLSLLWILCSLPIVTAGTATTALFYVMTRRINEKEKYIVQDFFKSFKMNFKQSAILNLIFMFLGAVLFLNFYIINKDFVFSNDEKLRVIFSAIYFIGALELLFVSLYSFPILSRFNMKNMEIIKTAFLLSNKHILSTLLMIIIIIGIAYITLFVFPPVGLCSAGLYASLSSMLFMRIFRKYKPELDAD